MNSVPCRNPRKCRVESHLLNSGASAKCGAVGIAVPARAANKSVNLRVPALVGASSGSSTMNSLSVRPPRTFSPADWANLRDDLLSEHAAQQVEASNPKLTVEQRNEHNFISRGIGTALSFMDDVDECDSVELSRQILAETQSSSHVPGKLAGLLLAAEMLKRD